MLLQINNNMRCIETDLQVLCLSFPEKINNNMRCIETIFNVIGFSSKKPDKQQHEMY